MKSHNHTADGDPSFGAAGCVHDDPEESAATGDLHDYDADGFEFALIDQGCQLFLVDFLSESSLGQAIVRVLPFRKSLWKSP